MVTRWYIFLPKKSQLEYILGRFGMENFGIFYGHLEYFTGPQDPLDTPLDTMSTVNSVDRATALAGQGSVL
jgi:hypothetical protein